MFVMSVVLMSCLLGGCNPAVNQTKDESCSSFEKAVPVWADGRAEEENVYLTFRTLVDGDGIQSAKVRLAASANYRLTVNGEFVSHGPCVAAHGFYRVDVCDITPWLHSGSNVVAIEVAGYNVPSYYLLAQPSFLQAEVVVGGRVIAATGDASFTAYELKQRHKSRRLSFQRPTAEEYTLTPEWRDCLTDVEWQGHSVPLATQEPKALLERGVLPPDYTLHAASALNDSLFRFHCNSSGFLGMVLHVKAPSRLQTCFDEILSADGHVNHTRMGFDASFALNLQPGDYVFETFEPYTMQYMEFRTIYGDVDVEYVYMRDYCGSGVDRAQFESDNPVLNRLFEAARETHRQNALDIFMDCPSRERAGWLCDSYFSARVAFDMSGHTRIERNFLENYLLPDTFPDIARGMLPMCYPSDHRNQNYIPNWAMWFVLELEEYLHRTGDRALVDRAKNRVYELVDFFRPFLNSDGLLEKLDKWVFVEWSAANDYVQDVNYPSNMLYARMLDAVAALYDDASLANQAEEVRAAIRSQSYDGRFFCDNAIRLEDGTLQRTDNHTEACQYYAFYLKTATPDSHPELWTTLKEAFGPIRHTVNPYPDVPFANAFIGNYLRLELLSEQGLSAQLLRECVAEYTKMANRTGTLWENMGDYASCNHGFAAHIAHVLLRDILGIADIDTSTRTVLLRFSDTGVKHCKGVRPLGDDEIRLEWFIVDGVCHYTLHLPKGYKAVVEEGSMAAVQE